jgi:very-short-patch-repair endonuclease
VVHGTTHDGLRVTTAERTLADLWRKVGPGYRNKMLREALRLKHTTPTALDAHLNAAAPRNRPRSLNVLLDRYRRLGLDRTKSDAEARGLDLLDARHVELPEVNITIAGFEADYVWPHLRLIVEVDGDQWHQDKARDAEKTAAWTRAGHRVRRVEADVIFGTPERFVEGVRRAIGAAAALPSAAA